jgi:hypothetical protein
MKTRSIEIVTHCYCPPGLDSYAQHLKWQVASLVHYPPAVSTTLVVCHAAKYSDDTATHDMILRLTDVLTKLKPPLLSVRQLPLSLGHLFRRAIGRNIVAKRCTSDVLWFTDCDYLFGPNCLREVAAQIGQDDRLCMPGWIWISKSHELGQSVVENTREVDLPTIPFDTFAKRRQRICIGGVQIVGGNLAREIGYCDSSKWILPVDPTTGFRSCRCDKAFRRMNKLSAKRLKIPSVCRLRHTQDGRDYVTNGQRVGKEAW